MCVTVTLAGRRPLVAEVQTLVHPVGGLEPSRRTTSGLDSARVGMAVAVLQQRAGLHLSRCDIYAATVGGVRLTEPAVDLAISLALAGAKMNTRLPTDVVAFGEVGLAGEIRSIAGICRRLAEAGRMGFRRAVVPVGTDAIAPDCPMRVSQVADVVSAIRTALVRMGSPAPADGGCCQPASVIRRQTCESSL
jgi:DNA repair protein RadA/Sms